MLITIGASRVHEVDGSTDKKGTKSGLFGQNKMSQ